MVSVGGIPRVLLWRAPLEFPLEFPSRDFPKDYPRPANENSRDIQLEFEDNKISPKL